jgi:hypothetical protein
LNLPLLRQMFRRSRHLVAKMRALLLLLQLSLLDHRIHQRKQEVEKI